MTKRRWGVGCLRLAVWLAVVCGSINLSLAQDVKVNIGGGGDSESEKRNQALAEKLPAQEQAATLRSFHAWNSLESILEIVALVALPLGIVATVLSFRLRRQKLAHETMRLLIEKGQSVPAELINPPPPVKPPKNDLRRGLVWLALGAGLLVGSRETEWLWSFALIPTFVGIAYLVCWVIGWMGEREGRQASGLWPGIFLTLLGLALMVAMRAMKHADGDWDKIADWWAMGLIPMAMGAAFLLHSYIQWVVERKRAAQG